MDEYAPRVTLVENSEAAERIWAMVHSDRGPYLICCWYRPPSPGDVETITSFEDEYRKHKDGATGVFVLGDLNVHSIRWLTHSARESVEGRDLCDTSSKYILDLVLTDVLDCTAKPCAAVADHKAVLTQVKFKIPETVTHEREVLHFSEADWVRMQSNIEEASWKFLSETFPSEGAQRLTEQLLQIAEDNIPRRAVKIKKSTHPWLPERGEDAVRRKHAAQGTEHEAAAVRECSDILLEEHYEYIGKMREKLMEAKPSSKSLWSNERRFTDRKQRVSTIPGLKRGTEWILEAEAKANCFVSAFESKNIMIDEEHNEYSAIAYVHPIFYCGLPTVEAT